MIQEGQLDITWKKTCTAVLDRPMKKAWCHLEKGMEDKHCEMPSK